VPAVTIPWATGPNGLPLGVQVIGRVGDDARALACAHWLQASGQPPI
jgi:Asp-tRNA(Asn)/Glu-tRNA(Gln) amidotransferase A subunit family amidase